MSIKTALYLPPLRVLVTSLLVLSSLSGSLALATEQEWTSTSGHFIGSYESEASPVPLNRIHAWTLSLKTTDGAPLNDAVVTADGGMPVHNHGLPTAPEVIAGDIPGTYLIQGLRFHMMGYWEIRLTIEAEGIKDTLVIPLEL